MDAPIKQCFEDRDFTADHHLISMNSINIGRILAQIHIYIFAYYCLASLLREDVEIVVPTGAAGSIIAGCLASMMGYPLRLVSAVNVNEVVACTLRDGVYSVSKEVYQTFSCAMDIQVPYNVERLLYMFSGQDSGKVRAWMEAAQKQESCQVEENTMVAMRKVITGYYIASDEDVKKVIKKMKTDFDYFVCSHTAIAMSYYFSHPDKPSDISRGVFSTASLEKFPEAAAAAGLEVPTGRVQHLFSKEEKFEELTKRDDWLVVLKEKIVSITKIRMAAINS